MNPVLARWLDRLDQGAIPVLGESVTTVNRLCGDENAEVTTFASAVETDPGLTLHLLRTINAAKRRHLGTEVTTVAHGLMMLGLSQLRQQLGATARIEGVQPETVRMALLRTFCRAFHGAYQARDWAILRRDSEPDELFAAALLHPLAEMLLWLHAPKEMQAIQRLAAQRDMEPEEAEYVVLGFGLDQLTLALAERWGLPELFRESLAPENARRPRLLGIMLAVKLAREAQFGWQHKGVRETIAEIADYLGWEMNALSARIHANAARAARLTGFYRVTPAAALLLSTADGNDACPGLAGRTTGTDFCLTPRPEIVSEVARELSADSVGALSPKDIVLRAVGGMHDGAGLNRVVFASLSRDGSRLEGETLVGAENDPVFNRFIVELDRNPLFAALMKRPQALWLNEGNRGKYWPLISEQLRHIVRTYSFFAMPVFVGNRPKGLFYADRHSDACKLDETAYKRFKEIGALAGKALARAGRTEASQPS